MRSEKNSQDEIVFQVSDDKVAKVTLDYFSGYDWMSGYLDTHPKILARAHQDLVEPLAKLGKSGSKGKGGGCQFTSDNVLRMILVKTLENTSFRGTVIRVDDSPRLRAFTRIHNGPMMDPSTLCRLNNAIRPETWKDINLLLAGAAVKEKRINGEQLRIDTTAVETNIRYPTDAGLLWDSYRVLSRLLRSLRDVLPDQLSGKRLQSKQAKKLYASIGRASGKRSKKARRAKKQSYRRLIGLVQRLLDFVGQVCAQVWDEVGRCAALTADLVKATGIVQELEIYCALGTCVVDQASRRVLHGEQVPNDEKIFSIFESHTELLIRGKAGKRIEFGHMVSIQQVGGKFITAYDVFEKRPADHKLVDAALKSHKALFGFLPRVFTGDKGFWEGVKKMNRLMKKIPVVSIGKKGRRTEEETAREHSRPFKMAQRFRAGIEGSIAFLKSVFGMWRCMNKGIEHFASTVGATVFVHNLLILARGAG